MPEAFICDYVRTPIGRFGGQLASVRTDDLGAIPLKALMERNAGVDWAAVDDVVFGCANQAGEDNRNVARMALLLAGLPKEVSGLDGQPPLRLRHGRRRHRRARHQGRRGGADDRRRRRIDEPRALRYAQGRQRLLAQRRNLRHDHRLAFRQPADEEAVRHRCHARDGRERRRRFLRLPRRPGCFRRAQPGQGRRRAGERTAGARRSCR